MSKIPDIYELPYPPTVNHYWGRKGKRSYLTDRAKAYRNTVKAMLYGIKPTEDFLVVHIDVYPPDSRKRDLDNICKSLLDACQHAGMYIDDYQISDLRLVRKGKVKKGKVIVSISTRRKQ